MINTTMYISCNTLYWVFSLVLKNEIIYFVRNPIINLFKIKAKRLSFNIGNNYAMTTVTFFTLIGSIN